LGLPEATDAGSNKSECRPMLLSIHRTWDKLNPRTAPIPPRDGTNPLMFFQVRPAPDVPAPARDRLMPSARDPFSPSNSDEVVGRDCHLSAISAAPRLLGVSGAEFRGLR